MRKKTLQVTNKTQYLTSIKKISDFNDNVWYLVRVNYVIDGEYLKTPILYLRINQPELADTYFDQITNIIETNGEALCVSKMKNWLWSKHVIRYLLTHKN